MAHTGTVNHVHSQSHSHHIFLGFTSPAKDTTYVFAEQANKPWEFIAWEGSV